MTNRQKSYYETLCRLCLELGRPVTVDEIAEAEGVKKSGAHKMIDELIYRGKAVWCAEGRKRYYWPRGWYPKQWAVAGRKENVHV